MAKDYTAPLWMTYKQAESLGAHVRKGEKGELVVYADTLQRTERNEKGEDEERVIPFMKGYTVFNVEQIEGLPAHFYGKRHPATLLNSRCGRCDGAIEWASESDMGAQNGRPI